MKYKLIIPNHDSWTQHSMWFVFTIIIILTIGKAYYIEAVQQQGWGPWSIGVGAKIHSLNWTNNRADADHEEQQVTIQSVVVNEIQVCYYICICILYNV